MPVFNSNNNVLRPSKRSESVMVCAMDIVNPGCRVLLRNHIQLFQGYAQKVRIMKILCKVLLLTAVSISVIGCHSENFSRGDGKTPCDAFPQTYTLTNGKVVVVVAPNIGRIIGYHRVGEPNMLWLDAVPSSDKNEKPEDEWINYGGDRVWLSPQDLWWEISCRHTPDGTTDGEPMEVIYADTRKIIIKSNVSYAHGIRLTRTISLPDDDTTVRIDNHLERVLANSYPVQIWAIAQVHLPKTAYLGLTKDRPSGKPDFVSPGVPKLTVDYNLGAARFEWDKYKNTKAGTYGRWVAAVYGKTVFVQYAPLDVDAKYYDRANCEIFVNPISRYMELELLSPIKYLPKGKDIDFTVTWKLIDLPGNSSQNDIVKQIECNTPKWAN